LGGRRTLALTDELDLVSTAILNATLLEQRGYATNAIALDLSKLTLIDSTGLRAVLFAKELSDRHGYEFVLIPGPSHVQRLFELAGLFDVLPFREA
jgi:anti-anti-sigma factor